MSPFDYWKLCWFPCTPTSVLWYYSRAVSAFVEVHLDTKAMNGERSQRCLFESVCEKNITEYERSLLFWDHLPLRFFIARRQCFWDTGVNRNRRSAAEIVNNVRLRGRPVHACPHCTSCCRHPSSSRVIAITDAYINANQRSDDRQDDYGNDMVPDYLVTINTWIDRLTACFIT